MSQSSLRGLEILGYVIIAVAVVYWYSTPGDVVVGPLMVLAVALAIVGAAHLMRRQQNNEDVNSLVASFGAPQQTAPDLDQAAAENPYTSPEELRRIAAERPDLHMALAMNPATYPSLLEWLRSNGEPRVIAAIDGRTQ